MKQNDDQELVMRVTSAVRSALSEAEGGHDWWHTHRVWQMACRLAQAERAELLIVELGALLHDVADAKFHDGDETAGPRKTEAILTNCGATKPVIDTVRNLVAHVSFKGGNHVQEFRSLELDVVQDADRLDAMGAIGIARAFSYGGYRGTPLHDPEIKPRLRMTREEYRLQRTPTINHFYEKLLLLKDRMNTKTGRQLAEQRHAFLEQYLEQFFAEWQGER